MKLYLRSNGHAPTEYVAPGCRFEILHPATRVSLLRITHHASGWPTFPTVATIPHVHVGLRVTSFVSLPA